MFGSATNTSNSWGNSSGFAKSNSFGGLSNNATGGGLFGSNNNTNSTSSGLFGNSNTNTSFGNNKSPAASGGLFGNSGQAPAAPSGAGLFGNSSSNTNAAPSGGLFGNSSSNTNAAPTGGLFGNASSSTNSTPASGGLFGNTGGNTANPSTTGGGLFGNSQAQSTNPSGGLFGNNNSTSNSAGGLFGNSSTSQNNNGGSGLFGTNTNTNASGGLFGSSNQPAQAGGLFGNSNSNPQSTLGASNNSSAINSIGSNPYNYDTIFNNIQKDVQNMPKSITESVFNNNSKENTNIKGYNLKQIIKPQENKSSLLSKLGQTFKLFRNKYGPTNSTSGLSAIKGLFTQPNYIDSKNKQNLFPKAGVLHNKRFNKKSYRSSVHDRAFSDIKRLVIKSKPLKFHLINADKVFKTKRRRIITDDRVPLRNFLSNNEQSDDDISDTEELEHKVPASYKKEQPFGKSYTDDSGENDPDNTEMNNGYWCKPSIKELNKMSIEQLSKVEDFTIGKLEHGMISYRFPVDLSSVLASAEESGKSLGEELFDNVVKFRKTTVQVYGGFKNKPPLGKGMNVPAVVTLVMPPESRSLDEHIKMLKNLTGMEYLSYNPFNCHFVFKVKHFSVWGLVDSKSFDEDERRRLEALKREQDQNEADATMEYYRLYENDKFQQELKRQKLNAYTGQLPGAWEDIADEKDNPLVVKSNMVNDEINRQIQLHKNSQTANLLADNVSDITIDSEDELRPDSPVGGLYSQPEEPEVEGRKYDYLKQLVFSLPKGTDMNELVDEKVFEPEITDDSIFNRIQIRPNLAVSDDWLIQLEFANDMNSSLTSYITSQRELRNVDIEKVDDLLFSSFNKKSSQEQNTKDLYSNTKAIEHLDFDEKYPQNISKIIYTLVQRASIETRFNKYPLVNEATDLTFRDLLINDVGDEEELLLLKLGSVLFDEVEMSSIEKYKGVDVSNTNLIHYLKKGFQKEIFGEWLKEFNKKRIDELLEINSEDVLESIFLNVCANNLKQAIILAINSNNSHLSALLTLLDSNDKAVQAISKAQLDHWNDTAALSLVPPQIIKIYQILAGDINDVVENLPWSVVLALKLFYGDQSIELHELIQNISSSSGNNVVIDILKIYYDWKIDNKSKALSDIKKSNANIKVKWIFHQVLSRRHDQVTENELTIGFGQFLEKIGLWKEAVFVYSHHTSDVETEKLIRNVIISNVDKLKDHLNDEESYLNETLKVPHSLIYEAFAIKHHHAGEYWLEGEALATAKLWEKAHENIVNELGPSAVIANNSDYKNHLLKLIEQFPRSGGIIPNWKQGAGVYSDFFQLNDCFDNAKPVDINQLDLLLSNISQISNETPFRVKVALSLISKRIGDIALAHKDDIKDVKNKIFALKLGENEREYFSNRI